MKQISRQIKATLLIGLFVFISGCAGSQYQRYSGDHLAESTRATLKPWRNGIQPDSSGSRFVLPVSIDDKEVDIPSPDEVSKATYFISPGVRAIKVVLMANIVGEKKQLRNPEAMKFHARTGHVYITKASFKSLNQGDVDTKSKLGFWIEDENTGEVVSGTRLTE